MTTATRQDARPVSLSEAAQDFERYARQAAPVIGGRALSWASLVSQFQALGVDPARMAPALAAQNEKATRAAVHWQKWINALDEGRAELVPIQVAGGPVTIAVRAVQDTGVGWWPIVMTVARYATMAAATAAGYLTIDSYQDTRRIEATARKTDADTRAALSGLVEARPDLAPRILQAMETADRAGADAGPDWVDRLTSAATGAAAGLTSGALMLLALWFFMRNNRRKNPRRRAAPRRRRLR